ncbi:aminoglycoside 3'-phosphotransferase [Cellulomonas sp. PhB143]|uniref:aminoglycoside 3'-phosphotransferase n=1 Tax=Cellulomonas sp. PhB143 TaxID=2485186 RepID=UPI000F495D6A|nr:aminoglycoside 3'-phosphotransferase [Cellulomonas sp. PhB143]ROS73538.1 kanamycin kinase [Cellulomonas sp. PhB143]
MSRVPVGGADVADVEPSAVVREIAAELALEGEILPVWRNQVGGLTFRVGSEHHLKWAPDGRGLDLVAEAERMAWARAYAVVPTVVGHGRAEDEAAPEDARQGTWLVTRTLPGASAVAPRWLADPETAARAIGAGLRTLHDALPVGECPFSWSARERLADARDRADAGDGPESWSPQHRTVPVAEALARLADPPAPDLVVCHGDACAPNTLLDDDGAPAGHVDLGSLGVADRWADLAVAAWSTEWNYGPGYDAPLYEAYGIEPDAEKIAYYRLLWDLS